MLQQEIHSTTIIGCGAQHREQANNMVLNRTGSIAEVNVPAPKLSFFHIHCTGLHHNRGGDIHDRNVPTQLSLQVGYKDLACKTVYCTPTLVESLCGGCHCPLHQSRRANSHQKY